MEGLSALALQLASLCEHRASQFSPGEGHNGGGDAAKFDALHDVAQRLYGLVNELEAIGE